jgi:pyruvate formate lyase activating enzyme
VTRALVADVVDASCVDGTGNRYVVFLQGCTFNCLACHNPQTIPRRPTAESRWFDIDALHADIASKAAFLSGVTVSGGEATLQWQAVHELFQRLASDSATSRLTRLVDSNGDAESTVWDMLATSMHGAMIDLKALDPDVHLALTGRDNRRVLASLRHLTALDRLTEVRLLIIPGVNDEPGQLAATARWLAKLDPVPPVAVQGFRREGTRPVAQSFHEATSAEIATAAATLVHNGLADARVSIRVHGVEPLISDR